MKMTTWLLAIVTSLTWTTSAWSAEWLMKLPRRTSPAQLHQQLRSGGQMVLAVEDMRFGGWYLIRTATDGWSRDEAFGLGTKAQASWVEPNYKIKMVGKLPVVQKTSKAADPVYTQLPARPAAADPMAANQWALIDTGFNNVSNYSGNAKVVVAVIDTGVDYNHPDLNANIWINPKESGANATNGVDDDGNGYIDDNIGWDFVENDNKPYDKTTWMGNPGHGTHCSGVIAAQSNNGFGMTGIASGVKIMPIRFLSEGGEGTTANAVKAVKYAIDNGAWILSNSWGGADENDADSLALREVFAETNTKGRLTIVAAGNESLDVDKQPNQATPASYNMPNQVTVAATGRGGSRASFSNYGKTLVHLGAPGVGILSTVPNGKFMNMDGTSMATPVVAGAAALFWSQRTDLDAMSVKSALLATVTPTASLNGMTTTGGRLNIENLMKRFVGF